MTVTMATDYAVIVKCRTGREKHLAADLTGRNPLLRVYIPQELTTHRSRHVKSKVKTYTKSVPAFKGYVFVASALQYWQDFSESKDCMGVLTYESGQNVIPHTIPVSHVDKNFDFTEKPKVKFAKGASVVIKEGPFQGRRGVVMASGMVELSSFGSVVRIKINHSMLEPC